MWATGWDYQLANGTVLDDANVVEWRGAGDVFLGPFEAKDCFPTSDNDDMR